MSRRVVELRASFQSHAITRAVDPPKCTATNHASDASPLSEREYNQSSKHADGASNAACRSANDVSHVRFGPVIPNRRAIVAQGAFARHHGNAPGLATPSPTASASRQNRTVVSVP